MTNQKEEYTTVIVTGHHAQISRLVYHINGFTIYRAELVEGFPNTAQIWCEYEEDGTELDPEDPRGQIIDLIDSLNDLIQGHGQLEVQKEGE